MGIPEKQRYDSIVDNFSQVAIYAALNEDRYIEVMNVLQMLMVQSSSSSCETNTPCNNEAGEATQENKLRSPPVIRSKGFQPLSKERCL
ncbi:hypothetical protein SLA2020_435640 [Shorea laevis]